MADLPRAVLSVDGNCGCALFGENLQEGEAECVEIIQRYGEPLHEAETRACWQAFQHLKARLAIPLTYTWYPRRPGQAGA